MQINQEKFQQFINTALNEAGVKNHVALVVIGDKLGLYKALAAADGLTSCELAQRMKQSVI